jgi:hypothetical protein
MQHFIKPGTGRSQGLQPARAHTPLTEVAILDALVQERQTIDNELANAVKHIADLRRRAQTAVDALDNAPAVGDPINRHAP